MNASKIFIGVMAVFVVNSSYAASYKNLKQWEQCRDKAESSVNQMEVGVAGVEYAISSQCGEPPAQEPSASKGSIGMHPYDVVRSKAWKNKFIRIAKAKYKPFVARLAVASETQLMGDWVVGDGMMPHSGGSDAAAFAINVKTEEVLAIMIEDGSKISAFGFSSNQKVPEYFRTWVKEHKR